MRPNNQFIPHPDLPMYPEDLNVLVGINPQTLDYRIFTKLKSIISEFIYPHSPLTDSWQECDYRSNDGGLFKETKNVATALALISLLDTHEFRDQDVAEHATTVAFGYVTGNALLAKSRAAFDYHKPTPIGFNENLITAMQRVTPKPIDQNAIINAYLKRINAKGSTMNNQYPPYGYPPQNQPQGNTMNGQYGRPPMPAPIHGMNNQMYGNPNQPQMGYPNQNPNGFTPPPMPNGFPPNHMGHPGYPQQPYPAPNGYGGYGQPQPQRFIAPNVNNAYGGNTAYAQQMSKQQKMEQEFLESNPIVMAGRREAANNQNSHGYSNQPYPNSYDTQPMEQAKPTPPPQSSVSSADELFRLERHQVRHQNPQPVEVNHGNPRHPEFITNDDGLIPTPEERKLINERVVMRGEEPINRDAIGAARAHELRRLTRELRIIRGIDPDDLQALQDSPVENDESDDKDFGRITSVTTEQAHVDDVDHSGHGGVRGNFNNAALRQLTEEEYHQPMTYREQGALSIPVDEGRTWNFEEGDDEDGVEVDTSHEESTQTPPTPPFPNFMNQPIYQYTVGLEADKPFDTSPRELKEAESLTGTEAEFKQPVVSKDEEPPKDRVKAQPVTSLEGLLDQAKEAGVDADAPPRVNVTELTLQEQRNLLGKTRKRATPAFVRTKSGLYKSIEPDSEIYLEDYKEERKVEYKDHKIPKLVRGVYADRERPEGFYKIGQAMFVSSRGKRVTLDEFSAQLEERLKNKQQDDVTVITETTKSSPMIAIDPLVSSTGSDDYQSEAVEILKDRIPDGVGIVADESCIEYTRSIHSNYLLNDDMKAMIDNILSKTTLEGVTGAIREFEENSILPLRETSRVIKVFTKHVNRYLGIIYGEGWSVDDAVADAQEIATLIHSKNITHFDYKEVCGQLAEIYVNAAEAAFMIQHTENEEGNESVITELEKILLLPIQYKHYELKHIGAAGAIHQNHHAELYDLLQEKFNQTSATTLKIVTLDNVVLTFCKGLGEAEEFYIVKQ